MISSFTGYAGHPGLLKAKAVPLHAMEAVGARKGEEV
jgi:hypothetical protein